MQWEVLANEARYLYFHIEVSHLISLVFAVVRVHTTIKKPLKYFLQVTMYNTLSNKVLYLICFRALNILELALHMLYLQSTLPLLDLSQLFAVVLDFTRYIGLFWVEIGLDCCRLYGRMATGLTQCHRVDEVPADPCSLVLGSLLFSEGSGRPFRLDGDASDRFSPS